MKIWIEKLSGLKFSSSEAKLNLGEMSQKQNLKLILDFINNTMDIHPMMSKWKVESKNWSFNLLIYCVNFIYFLIDIYEKDIISILHLLVAIVKYFKVPLSLPENITVKVIVIQKKKKLEKLTVTEQITGGSSLNEAKKGNFYMIWYFFYKWIIFKIK